MASAIRTVQPAVEPVTLDELKQHARISFANEDTLLLTHITTAREYCERYLGQAFVNQTWRMTIDRWPVWTTHGKLRAIELPWAPLQSITSIVYNDTAGASTVLASSAYTVGTDQRPGIVTPLYGTFWPIIRYQVQPIQVTYVAGYGGAAATDAQSAAAVPMPIKTAIKLYAQYLYQVRDVDGDAPKAVHALLDSCSFGNYTAWFPDLVT